MRRREFLNGSVVAGAAALISPATALAKATTVPEAVKAARAPEEAVAPFGFSRAWFERNLHTRFQIHTDHGRVSDAELVELKGGCRSGRPEQFSTVFRVSGGQNVSGLRRVEHAEGRFDLFLGKPHDIGDAQLCQAHFSLLV